MHIYWTSSQKVPILHYHIIPLILLQQVVSKDLILPSVPFVHAEHETVLDVAAVVREVTICEYFKIR